MLNLKYISNLLAFDVVVTFVDLCLLVDLEDLFEFMSGHYQISSNFDYFSSFQVVRVLPSGIDTSELFHADLFVISIH